ncbi:helix-turn-helix domain-containing protein [Enterococcus olivae]
MIKSAKSLDYLPKKSLPFYIIHLASRGNLEAIKLILKHYEPYMNKLSLRHIYDANGIKNQTIDPYIYRCLETKLIIAILKFN